MGILFIFAFSWIVDKGGRRMMVPVIGAACVVHFVAKFAWILYDTTPFGYKWYAASS